MFIIRWVMVNKVLFLSAWYPHRYDAMSGLFVRKHAEAVARLVNVCVLYLYADSKVDSFDVVSKKSGRLTEIFVYFPFCSNKYIRVFSKAINYFRAFLKGYKVVLEEFGSPDICHANVLTRSAFLAFLLFKTKQIPYVISEHWSRYLPENYSYKGIFRKLISKMVVKNAQCIIPVSALLQKSMQHCGLQHQNYQVVPNVVDDFFYNSQPKQPRDKKRILHISCFDERAKNICGILRMIKQLSSKRDDFELLIIGEGIDFERVRTYSKKLCLSQEAVRFLGEQTPQQVCDWLYQSDFLLMFSNYETSGVVFSEALACGRPFVSTPVGIVPEITSRVGRIVPIGDEEKLLEAVNVMLDNFQQFDEQALQSIAQKFSYFSVADVLMEIYNRAIR